MYVSDEMRLTQYDARVGSRNPSVFRRIRSALPSSASSPLKRSLISFEINRTRERISYCERGTGKSCVLDDLTLMFWSIKDRRQASIAYTHCVARTLFPQRLKISDRVCSNFRHRSKQLDIKRLGS